MKQIYHCVDCNIIIAKFLYKYRNNRCENCQHIFKAVRYYKKCKECRKILKNYVTKEGLCRSCSQLDKRNGNYGKGEKILGKNNPNYGNKFQMNGSKNGNWKGGITNFSLTVRQIIRQSKLNLQRFERDNYTCQFCKVRGGVLEVDHIKPFSMIIYEFLQTYKHLSFKKNRKKLLNLVSKYKDFWDMDNLRTVHKKCHKKITALQWKDKKLISNERIKK